MVRRLLALTLGLAIAVTCLPAWSAGKAEAFDPGAERIGGLRLGLPEKDLGAAVPCPPKKLKEIYEGATGLTVQTWQYPDCGLALKMSAEKKSGAKTVDAVTVTSPSPLKTGRGIGIGSTEAEVEAAYGRFRDKEGASRRGKVFVAGSVYGGLILDFKAGRVVRMFLGAAAE